MLLGVVLKVEINARVKSANLKKELKKIYVEKYVFTLYKSQGSLSFQSYKIYIIIQWSCEREKSFFLPHFDIILFLQVIPIDIDPSLFNLVSPYHSQ